MEKNEYRIMYDIEDNYWWYLGLHTLIRQWLVRECPVPQSIHLLDAGCGTGALLQKLRPIVQESVGFDLFSDALTFCRQRHLSQLAQASILEIPFLDQSIDIVTSMDVLCDLQSEEEVTAALREIFRILRPNGLFVFNLPAYPALKSSHDIAVNNILRFSKQSFAHALQTSQFSLRYLTYRNTVLFPPLAAVRLARKFYPPSSDHGISSDLSHLPGRLNQFLTNILLAENWWLSRGKHLPFGLSLFGVAQKDSR